MDDRKKYIVDDSIRTHCDKDADASESVFESAISTMSTWIGAAVRTVSGSFSAPAPPSHSPSSKRPKRKPRRITINGDTASLIHAAQIPLPPSPTDPSFTDPSLPFQNLQRHNGTLPSPSTRRTNGHNTSLTLTKERGLHCDNEWHHEALQEAAYPPSSGRPLKLYQEEVNQRLVQELFTLKRSTGQSAAEFKEFINYAEKIDKIDAAGGVFAVVSKHVSRRHSFTPRRISEVNQTDLAIKSSQDELNSDFLRRAIKRATDSLHGTRAPNNLPYYINELRDLCKQPEAPVSPTTQLVFFPR
ncbi:hypothetical protein BN14_01760 [Rhizoctonia solani AG-1 IB]|uniref:Uncharacterized protein n=1 Tax=Thanatephorus cucumeris (strain AG1-IB / isolate 7/3/14) TaxID=1108050 RepID=M5BKA6_THACB|nr:hypothetical protein BN14_01760 [Rhizoctonia solani AG-1 IB]